MHGPSRLYVTPNEENNWLESESISVRRTLCYNASVRLQNERERDRKETKMDGDY